MYEKGLENKLPNSLSLVYWDDIIYRGCLENENNAHAIIIE
jgi:hypothetical protein